MYNKTFKFELERGSQKKKCPNCHKKTFVLYVNNETGEYLNDTFGRCDREMKCGYFKAPSQQKEYIPVLANYTPPKPSFVPLHYVDSTFNPAQEKKNNFLKFLNTLFTSEEVNSVVGNYLISTCSHWGSPGATIFWQIDEKEKVRTGQIILYDPISGKRIKEPFSHIDWYHSLLKKKGEITEFNLYQCLFGLHLVKQNPVKKLIAIVEAPKTACIMSIVFPKYLWLATSGLSNLKQELFQPLKNKTLILYPDLGASDKWRNKAKSLIELGYHIEISELLETKADFIPPGSDIADYFILQKQKEFN